MGRKSFAKTNRLFQCHRLLVVSKMNKEEACLNSMQFIKL